ncbi:hypothetical protein ES705_32508 [subsurface metagenome]
MSELQYQFLPLEKTIMHVRMRCPCCGMWARLGNLKRDHILNDELTQYSGGRARIFSVRNINSGLTPFWVSRLRSVLARFDAIDDIAFSIERHVEIGYDSPLKLREILYDIKKDQSQEIEYSY